MVNNTHSSSSSRYNSIFFGISFYNMNDINYIAKGISAIYKYLYITLYCLAHYRIIKRSVSLSNFMKALHKAHYYGFILSNKSEQIWVDEQCKKYNLSSSKRIILCFNGNLNARKQKIVFRGFWWIEQPLFILFIIGFTLSFIGLFGISLIHFINDPMGLKTTSLILFCITYSMILFLVFCMLKADLWDSHILLRNIHNQPI